MLVLWWDSENASATDNRLRATSAVTDFISRPNTDWSDQSDVIGRPGSMPAHVLSKTADVME